MTRFIVRFVYIVSYTFLIKNYIDRVNNFFIQITIDVHNAGGKLKSAITIRNVPDIFASFTNSYIFVGPNGLNACTLSEVNNLNSVVSPTLSFDFANYFGDNPDFLQIDQLKKLIHFFEGNVFERWQKYECGTGIMSDNFIVQRINRLLYSSYSHIDYCFSEYAALKSFIIIHDSTDPFRYEERDIDYAMRRANVPYTEGIKSYIMHNVSIGLQGLFGNIRLCDNEEKISTIEFLDCGNNFDLFICKTCHWY